MEKYLANTIATGNDGMRPRRKKFKFNPVDPRRPHSVKRPKLTK